jgi:filamentous hemagglutinin
LYTLATDRNVQARTLSAIGNAVMNPVDTASGALGAARSYLANTSLPQMAEDVTRVAAGAALTGGLSRLTQATSRAHLGSVGSEIPAPFSRLSPGGGLQAHENAGGHLIGKHVGKSEDDLHNRLAVEPHINGSSSFYNRTSAEDAVSRVLDANQKEVSDWLRGAAPRLRLDQTLMDPVGISVTRGANGAVDASSARVILVRDQHMSTGYKILTGFPTLP